ncbi:hypothetical protein CIHG_00348 [Coccidioides immitis H538.4]|uniref:Protein kinase domain-containing protein n=2 Tax=Coccidioides immitis TaxID=5501 RepID=A0A0J8RCB8_COCIT|nr:hypothetical protein CIRG_07169 [Coccidioides immitis RMSCC 2394]KMU82567.1 hypothetical protein CIHG_00348 [Coccidioides immitis H538.4]
MRAWDWEPQRLSVDSGYLAKAFEFRWIQSLCLPCVSPFKAACNRSDRLFISAEPRPTCVKIGLLLPSMAASKHRGGAFMLDNFLLGFEDSGVLESYARQQESNPAPFWDDGGRPVFQSRPDFGHLRKGVGLVQISDFSAAVFGNVPKPHNHDIQPQPFRAPEVLLKATWTYSADIWNLGTMVCMALRKMLARVTDISFP